MLFLILFMHKADEPSPCFLPLLSIATLMDLWNNQKGADAFASGLYSSPEEAVQSLLEQGLLITSNDQVAAMYGFDEEKQVSKTFGNNEPIDGFNVTFDYSNGYVTDIR